MWGVFPRHFKRPDVESMKRYAVDCSLIYICCYQIIYSRLTTVSTIHNLAATNNTQAFSTSSRLSADFSVPGTQPFKTRFEDVEVPEKKLMYFLKFVKMERLSEVEKQIHEMHVEALKVKNQVKLDRSLMIG